MPALAVGMENEGDGKGAGMRGCLSQGPRQRGGRSGGRRPPVTTEREELATKRGLENIQHVHQILPRSVYQSVQTNSQFQGDKITSSLTTCTRLVVVNVSISKDESDLLKSSKLILLEYVFVH